MLIIVLLNDAKCLTHQGRMSLRLKLLPLTWFLPFLMQLFKCGKGDINTLPSDSVGQMFPRPAPSFRIAAPQISDLQLALASSCILPSGV